MVATMFAPAVIGDSPARRVTYRVFAGDMTAKIVEEVQQCCGDIDTTRAYAHEIGQPCPAAQLPCEIVWVQIDNDQYEVKGSYSPATNRPEPNHRAIKQAMQRFSYADTNRRIEQIVADLRILITCHEHLYHGIARNPKGFPAACQICGPGQLLPGPTSQQKGQ